MPYPKGKPKSEQSKKRAAEKMVGENNPMKRLDVRIAHRKAQNRPEVKAKARETRLGELNPMYGVTREFSEETIERQRQAHLGEKNPMYGKIGENNPNFGRKHTEIELVEMREGVHQHYVDHPEAREEQAIRTARMMSEGVIKNYDTTWERILQRLLDFLGVDYQPQYRVGRYVPDFADIESKIIYEADGPCHDDSDQIEHDRKRDTWLREQGWIVKRFHYMQLVRLERVLNHVRES